MTKGKAKSRVLAWMLTLAMVLSMVPVTAFAEENPQPSGCTHIHDETCGYVEAVAEVPCDQECVDTDGDGVIDHVEVCAYTPAVEGQPCTHIHDENCGGLTEDQPEKQTGKQPENQLEDQTKVQTEEVQPGQAEPELSPELIALKERIDALPTGEEYRPMTADEQDAVYEEAAEISEKYIALSEEEQNLIDITRLEDLFAVMNEGIEDYNTTDPVEFLNSGYPYGKEMNSEKITLVIEVDGKANSYRWQVAGSKDGSFEYIPDASNSTYTFAPTSGKWYRCVVDGTASQAVMAVKPGQDGRTWTYPNQSWYISNGTMAYMVNGTIFDVTGLYTKGNTNYMLQTSFSKCWYMFSSTVENPEPVSVGSIREGDAQLDALRVSFSESDAYALIFEADLADDQKAFSFGCDTQLGDRYTSGDFSDYAALNAMVKNGVLQQVAMIGAGTVAGAAETDPAFVIAPKDSASRFWIGKYYDRQTYAYNNSGGTAYETIDNQNVVTLLEGIDSGMTMSWMNIPSGGSVRFQFSVGNVAHTGASTVAATATGWSGTYDGDVHQITVNVTSPVENASITYSSTADGYYSTVNPSFKKAGEYTVYYRVTAEDYYPVSGSATITINPKGITSEMLSVVTDNGKVKVAVKDSIGDNPVTLVENADYTVSEDKNGNSIITGIGNYTDTVKVTKLEDTGSSKIATTVVIDESVEAMKPSIKAVSEDDAKNTLLTVISNTTIKDKVTSGTADYNALNYLEMKDLDSNTVSETEKGLILAEITQNNAIPSNAAVGMYLDLSMYMTYSITEGGTVLESNTKRITDTSDNALGIGNGYKQIVTLIVPEELRQTASNISRTYYIIRVHEESSNYTVEKLNVTQNGYTLTFSTDKFSTYAIAYVDRVILPQSSNSSGSDTSGKVESTYVGTYYPTKAAGVPATGDHANIAAFFGLLGLGAVGFVVIRKKKRA